MGSFVDPTARLFTLYKFPLFSKPRAGLATVQSSFFQIIKLEGPRAYVMSYPSEQIDFVGCGRKCLIEVDRFYDKELTQDDR